jgi:hypothetical protein
LFAALTLALAGCAAMPPPPARDPDAAPNCRPVVMVICVFSACREIARPPPEPPPAGAPAPR